VKQSDHPGNREGGMRAEGTGSMMTPGCCGVLPKFFERLIAGGFAGVVVVVVSVLLLLDLA